MLIAGNVSLVVTLLAASSLHSELTSGLLCKPCTLNTKAEGQILGLFLLLDVFLDTHVTHLWNDNAPEHVQIMHDSSSVWIRRAFLTLILVMILVAIGMNFHFYRKILACNPFRRQSVSFSAGEFWFICHQTKEHHQSRTLFLVNGISSHLGRMDQKQKRIQNFVSSSSHRRLSMLCFCSFLPPIISHFCEPICFNRLFLWTFMCSHLLQVKRPHDSNLLLAFVLLHVLI